MVLKYQQAQFQQLQESKKFQDIKKQYFIVLNPKYIDTYHPIIKISDNLSPENILKEYVFNILSTNYNKSELFKKSLQLLSNIIKK